ncbi:hypothetical protein HN604_01645 [archaeon]|nr:hypothetical protein [archaeon]MBT6606429.1 hypothetical protein [archaeon]MBT7251402.1 hypothetical protein [archaeon]MBT7660766.1 hypothetical protein [archaeon]
MTPSWKPEPDSPVAFFSTPEDLEFYAPTEKSMVSWMRTVPRYKELTDEQFHEAWETPGFPEAWKLDREHLALRTFIGAYQDREYDRWFAGQSSVALESEIQPVVSFIASLPSPGAAEKLITEYSSSVIQAIYKNGEKQPQKDPVSARWPLFGELTNQASLDTELVGQTLDGFLPS